MTTITKLETEVRAQNAPWNDAIELLVMHRDATGAKTWYASDMTFSMLEQGVRAKATISLPRTAAQELMDNLWSCGLRPSEGTGSAGSLAAVERHLKDMQRLVFDKPPAPHRP